MYLYPNKSIVVISVVPAERSRIPVLIPHSQCGLCESGVLADTIDHMRGKLSWCHVHIVKHNTCKVKEKNIKLVVLGIRKIIR